MGIYPAVGGGRAGCVMGDDVDRDRWLTDGDGELVWTLVQRGGAGLCLDI